MTRMIPSLLVGLAIMAAVLHADTWESPKEKDVFSRSGQFRVHMTPGKGRVGTTGSESAPKPEWATATLYAERGNGGPKKLLTFSLMNPVAPVDMLLTDQGRLLTLDNHSELGYGRMVVLYDTDGRVLKAHSLADLFTAAERQRFRRTVSSIWWRKAHGVLGGFLSDSVLSADQRTLRVVTSIEDLNLEINLATGECIAHRL